MPGMRNWRVVVWMGLMLALPAVAVAQVEGGRTDIGAKAGAQTFNVRGHLIFWLGGGLDLDVIGDVTSPALGTIRGVPSLVQGTAYPDVYVRTQRRIYAGAGIGIFQKTELFARYTEASNPASPVVIGQYGASNFPVRFDNYRDRLIEFGLRKYIATPRSTRQYFGISYGRKTVEALNVTLQTPGGDIDVPLYAKSTVPAIGVDLGLTWEFKHIGLFGETGFRFQKRLKGDDSGLALYGLEDFNHTGIRLFIPATIGVHVRF
jgi:hypothetical protein